MTCTCACHELEENHEPDDCYCMRIQEVYCPQCHELVEPYEEFSIQVDEKTGQRICTVHDGECFDQHNKKDEFCRKTNSHTDCFQWGHVVYCHTCNRQVATSYVSKFFKKPFWLTESEIKNREQEAIK